MRTNWIGDGVGGHAGTGRAEGQKMASAAGLRSVWGWSDEGTGLGQSDAQDNEKVRKKEMCLESSCPLCHSSDVLRVVHKCSVLNNHANAAGLQQNKLLLAIDAC